jgi:carbonic anhydrase
MTELIAAPIGCQCQDCRPPGGLSLTRRHLVSRAIAGAAVGASLTGVAARRVQAQTTLTPDAALERLIAGNRRFVAGRLDSFQEDLDILKQNNVAAQQPFAGLLSCADSRVPVELAFDQSIGHIFVARVAGNICTPEIIASLEYGAAVLGTAVILVLGHSGCGAVKATISAKAVPGQISALYAPIHPAVQVAGNDLEAAIRANAKIQADILRTASPVVADLTDKGKLKVVSGYYDIGSGQVSLLD